LKTSLKEKFLCAIVLIVNTDVYGLSDVNCWEDIVAFYFYISVLRQSLISAGTIAFGNSLAKLIVFISTSKVRLKAAIFIRQPNKNQDQNLYLNLYVISGQFIPNK
jgi:hypothetical protein